MPSKEFLVWPITCDPVKDDRSEGFDLRAAAEHRACELTSNGDAWLIGEFQGYGNEAWAEYKVISVAFDGRIFSAPAEQEIAPFTAIL
jgi:hypothetical protein